MSASQSNEQQPDGLAIGVSHAVVGVPAAIVVGYVLVTFMGMRKAGPIYHLIAAGGAIWLHHELDAPVAKRLEAAGL